NNQVEMLLNYRATFEDVEGRAVEADDYVTVDLKAVENADNFAAEGRMLIAGSDSNPAEFNEALIGANVDDVKTVTWTDEVEEGEEAETHTVEVTVKGIKVRNTPELTDELVKSDFGFDSIDAMRDAIKIEIEQDKASRLPAEKENRCVSALAERLQLDEMDADYEQSVFEELGQNFLSNLAARGMTLDTWLPASGLTMEQFIGDLHKQANDVARSPWRSTPSPVSSRSRSPRTTSTPSSRRPASGRRGFQGRVHRRWPHACRPESIRRSKAVDHLVENAKVTEVDETAKDAE
ncbi:MAG: trigger factor, partial [Collinsella sp.]